MKKDALIKGRYFEIINSSDKYSSLLFTRINHYYDDIYDAYTKPSQDKVDIYKDWSIWWEQVTKELKYNEMLSLKIISRNANVFSLCAWLSIENYTCILYITKNHNRVYVTTKYAVNELKRL